MTEEHYQKVKLLVKVLPFVAEESCFGLKGGTAINLFVRELPRLSIDIDLAYLPITDRDEALSQIQAALIRIDDNISRSLSLVRVQRGKLHGDGTINKLFIRSRRIQIKIEVTPVLRGCFQKPEIREVTKPVQERFGYAKLQLVSFEDLYAGKIVAALDRQHPRDLFDVHGLLQQEGIDISMRCAFLIYLVSHHRPLFALLEPTRHDMKEEYDRSLVEMMEIPVTLSELEQTRQQLIETMVGLMPEEHKRFLISCQENLPDWQLLRILDATHVKNLPAVRWRLMKWASLTNVERASLVKRLELAIDNVKNSMKG